MKIFAKCVGDVIRIGDEVQVCVLATDGETVRLGINAPRDIVVREVDPQPPERTLSERHVAHDAPGSDDEHNGPGSKGFTRKS